MFRWAYKAAVEPYTRSDMSPEREAHRRKIDELQTTSRVSPIADRSIMNDRAALRGSPRPPTATWRA